jgi:hypothetical protein
MKYLIILVALISLIAINTLSLDKRRSRRDGTGTFDEGYTCPGLSITSVSTTEDNVEEVLQDAYFKPSQIDAPSDDTEKIGWAFKLTAAPATSGSKLLVLSGTQYYLPYRLLNCDFAVRPSATSCNLILEGTAYNDNKEYFKVKLVLPHGYYKTYITENQANTIVNSINLQCNTNHNLIKTYKSSLNKYFGDYSTNKDLFDASSSSATQLAAQKTAEQAKQTALTAQIKTYSDQLKPINDSITKTQNTIDDYTKKKDQLYANANGLKTENTAIDVQVKLLEGTTIPNYQSKKAAYKLNFDAALVQIDKYISDVKASSAPHIDSYWAAVRKAIAEDNKTKTEVTALLNKIYP